MTNRFYHCIYGIVRCICYFLKTFNCIYPYKLNLDLVFHMFYKVICVHLCMERLEKAGEAVKSFNQGN